MNKICFIMPFHISEGCGGGAEVQAWLLAKELAKRGYRVSYIAESVKGKAGTTEQRDGVEIYWLKHYRHFRWRNAFAYYQAIKRVNPDLLVQRMSSYVTGVIGLYAKRHHKPFAWICTDNWSPSKWLFLKTETKSFFQKAIVKKISGLIFIVEAFFLDVLRHYGMRQITHAFTQNGLQKTCLLSNFKQNSLRISSGHEIPKRVIETEKRFSNKIILWVANLGRNKRPELFIELARSFQNYSWQFLMIGDRGDSGYKKQLFTNLPQNFKWLGKLPFEDTLKLFDKATVFVNTSKEEGFPNTFIQAWLRGVPVVSLAVDPDDIVSKNKLGYVTHGDLEQMKVVLESLMSNRDKYLSFAEQVTGFALKHYTVEKVADQFLEIVADQPIKLFETQLEV